MLGTLELIFKGKINFFYWKSEFSLISKDQRIFLCHYGELLQYKSVSELLRSLKTFGQPRSNRSFTFLLKYFERRLHYSNRSAKHSVVCEQ